MTAGAPRKHEKGIIHLANTVKSRPAISMLAAGKSNKKKTHSASFKCQPSKRDKDLES